MGKNSGKSPFLTDEQNDLCYSIQFAIIRAITDMNHDKMWEIMKEAIQDQDNKETAKLNGLPEGIRCAMCTNPMRSESGCDGGCQFDEAMYKRVMSVIDDTLGSRNGE